MQTLTHLYNKIIAHAHIIIAVVFFIAFSTLTIGRHMQFESYGFDLGIVDQTVWNYSRFQQPITTIQFYVFTSKLSDHFELIYAIISPAYWLWSDPRSLLLLESLSVIIGSLAIVTLAKKLELNRYLTLTLQAGFLIFFGTQHGLWFDVHNVGFAIAPLSWFLYAVHLRKIKLALVMCLLVISAKENLALLTGSIALTYIIIYRYKEAFLYAVISALYLAFIFGIYFPYMTPDGYRYDSDQTYNLNPIKMIDSPNKRETLGYSLFSVGFIPILNPLTLIPALVDLATYFVLADQLKGTHGLFMHYRMTLAPLLFWATVLTISKRAKLNNAYTALYIILISLFLQYHLHLPLSYLSKNWFWQNLSQRQYIHDSLKTISPEASVVTQNNLVPHLSRRKEIFVIWPQEGRADNQGIGTPWLRWAGKPHYLVVNTASQWDIRHLLMDPQFFRQALQNMEQEGYIIKESHNQDTTIYSIQKQP